MACTKGSGSGEELLMELTAGAYFGERSLLRSGERRAANVIARGPAVSLSITKAAFEREFGGDSSLTEAIERDRRLRERAAEAAVEARHTKQKAPSPESLPTAPGEERLAAAANETSMDGSTERVRAAEKRAAEAMRKL